MATIREKLQAEINRANETTKKADVTVHNAVGSLIDGYGKGGGSEYKFGYQRPSNFPDLDSVAEYPSDINELHGGAFGVLVKSEMDNVGYKVASPQEVRLYTVEDGELKLVKSIATPSSTDTAIITAEDFGEYDVLLVWSKKSDLANGYTVDYANTKTAYVPRYIESYVYNHPNMYANSANFTNDRKGFSTVYTQKMVFDNCVIKTPYAMCGNGAVKEIVFKNCTFNTTLFQVFLWTCPALEVITFDNCTHTAVINNVDRFLYQAFNVRSLDLSMFDFSGVTNQANAMRDCSQLQHFSGINIKCSWNFSWNDSLSHDSLVNIIDKVQTVDTNPTLTLGTYHKAKLTTDEIAIATQKGWTIA